MIKHHFNDLRERVDDYKLVYMHQGQFEVAVFLEISFWIILPIWFILLIILLAITFIIEKLTP